MTLDLNLPALALGERIQDPLLVLDVDQRGGDSPHTILTLSNRSGSLPTAPFWHADQPKIAGISKGDVVQVIGDLTAYRDRRQLRVTSIRVLPRESVDWRALMPSVGDVAGFWEVLDKWRREIRAPRLAATLGLLFDDPEFRRRYGECPASLAGHHAALGGLLKHTTEVAAIGRAIARVSGADQELVLAGVLLHDMGKLEAYSWDGSFAMTEAGSLLGHVVLGCLMLDRRVGEEETDPCTEQELQILHHLILSHHGRLEFGAAVPPMTLEAEVLHYADDASAKTASMADALADADNFSGDELVSAKTIWQLDRRRAYRGGSDWGRESSRDQR
ncbi:MAG: HD domain-containing protein [Gemmatimonadales bacterium]